MEILAFELKDAIDNCSKHQPHTMDELNSIYQQQKEFIKQKIKYQSMLIFGIALSMFPLILVLIGINQSYETSSYLVMPYLAGIFLSVYACKCLISPNYGGIWDIVPEKELIEVKNEINQHPETSTKLTPIIDKWLLNGPITYKELNLLQDCLRIYSKMTNLEVMAPSEINENELIFLIQKELFLQKK